MLTIFSTPKPFVGHSNVIQRNAIKSWTLVHPDVEVILVGDDVGTNEVCQEFGLQYQPHVQRTEIGTKYLASIFDAAQEMARYDVMCYVNCDIILTSDFRWALEQVVGAHRRFLMVGRRWDTNITEPWDFKHPAWEDRVRKAARNANMQRANIFIDYFAFSRALYYQKIPPFVIGRPGWDPWLVWFAASTKAVVVDATRVVTAIHQNHDYSYHRNGAKGVGSDDQARRNYKLLGSWWHYHTTDSATQRLTVSGLCPNRLRFLAPVRQALRRARMNAWFALLDLTRPVRHPLGIKKKGRVPEVRAKI